MQSLVRKAVDLYSEFGLLVMTGAAARSVSRRIPYFAEAVISPVELGCYATYYYYNTDKSRMECLVDAKRGFKPKSYFFLGLDERDTKQYLPGTDSIRFVNKNASDVLNDKVAIYSIFGEIVDRFPTLYGTIHDGRYVSQVDEESQSLRAAVEVHGTVVVKPADLWQGKGVHILSYESGKYRIDGDFADEAAIDQLQRDSEYENYMVTAYIQQHSYADEIFDGSTNSIRVLTALDPETGKPKVVRAAHRFGTVDSAPIDNWESGGVAAPIDPESGEIRPLVVLDKNGKRQRADRHPGTNTQVTGVKIPRWEEVRETICQGAESYQMARLIAWDVVITEDGPMLLEASGAPGVHTLQLDNGLLKDPVIQRVFEQST